METIAYDQARVQAKQDYREALATCRGQLPRNIDQVIQELRRTIDDRNETYPGLIAGKRVYVTHAALQTALLYQAIELLNDYRTLELFMESGR